MQLKFGYKDEVVRRKRFISKLTGKIEDEYISQKGIKIYILLTKISGYYAVHPQTF